METEPLIPTTSIPPLLSHAGYIPRGLHYCQCLHTEGLAPPLKRSEKPPFSPLSWPVPRNFPPVGKKHMPEVLLYVETAFWSMWTPLENGLDLGLPVARLIFPELPVREENFKR